MRKKKIPKSFFGIAKGIGSLTKEDKQLMEGKLSPRARRALKNARATPESEYLTLD